MKKFFLLFALTPSLILSQTEFSQEKANDLLKVLSIQIGPRPMGSPAEKKALQFAMRKFKEFGCDTSYIVPFDRSSRVNTTSGIAVGVKRGATKRIVIIGGHIDSAGPEVPGADDDGSGSAVVMELARVFGKRNMQSTLVFTCFGGEEQGLEGSRYFANHFEDIDSVALMLQIDMANGLGIIDVDGDTYGRSAPPWLVQAAVEEFTKLGYEHLRYPTHAFVLNYAFGRGAGSDHESFLDKGIPALDFSTDISKPIHTPQDNFENFDPRGLQRSGDVVLKLVERFDSGIPDKELAKYWLYVIHKTPIFVPYWTIKMFVGIAVICAIVAFVITRKRRLVPRDIRWSGIRMLLFTFVIVLLTWISSDIAGILKGSRYPWTSEIPLYFLLAFLFGALGVWLMLRVASKLPSSRCPYVFYNRASIILILYTLLFAWASVKLALYPAGSLLLLSLAMLSRNTIVKIILILLSPLLMVRLIFNEWIDLIFHSGSAGTTTISFSQNLALSGVMVLLFTLYMYPLTLGFAAVYRDANSPRILFAAFRSRWGGIVVSGLVIAMIAYLYPREVYSKLWYRNVTVEETYEPDQGLSHQPGKPSVSLRSSEYLDGVRVSWGNRDTLLTGRITDARIPLITGDSTTHEMFSPLVHIDRIETQIKTGDTTDYKSRVILHSKTRPYTVSITYTSRGKELNFSSEKMFSMVRSAKTLRWYSFPDTVLTVPVEFQIAGSDSVRESIEVVFNVLTHPMHFYREKTNFFPRTTYYESKVYRP